MGTMGKRNEWLTAEQGTIRLWLDDVRQMPTGYTHWAKTASEAINLIKAADVEHISFDHDLGGDTDNPIPPLAKPPTPKSEAGADGLTGYDVAKFIEEGAHNGTLPKMTWDIHSANPSGTKMIKLAMESADRFWGMNREAGYPQHPDTVIIPRQGKPPMTEGDIWRYYESVKDKIVPEMEGFNILIKKIVNTGPLMIRNDPKTGQSITISTPEEFDRFNDGRNAEFHCALKDRFTKMGWVDLDPKPGYGKDKALEVARFIVTEAEKDYEFAAEIFDSGGRGYHVRFGFDYNLDVDLLRADLKAWLEQKVMPLYPKTTTGETKGDDEMRLDVSTLHVGGSLRCPYSLNATTGDPEVPYHVNLKAAGALQRVSYIVHMPGHKNSKGEDSPWVIKSHETGKIIGSYKSKAAAEHALKMMHVFKHAGQDFKFDPNSTVNEGRWRLRDPKEFDQQSFRRWKEWAGVAAPDGITFIVGDLLKGKKKAIQTIRFDKSKWDEDKAGEFWDGLKGNPGFEKLWTWPARKASGKRLVIMRGLPGSGKSTKAREYGGTIVSADDYFMQDDKYMFDPNQLGAAHNQSKNKCEEAMKRGDPTIVVDNTNVRARDYKDYVKLAEQYGYDVEIDSVGTGGMAVEELAERNKHGVPLSTIENMVEKWEGEPLYPESDLKAITRKALLALNPLEIEDNPHLDLQSLRESILAELDAINLYEQMADQITDENVKRILLDIAKEEKTHAGEFQAILKKLDPEFATELENGEKEVSNLTKATLVDVAMIKTSAIDPAKSKDIMAKIEAVAAKNGYKAYAVGGFVRDELLGRQPKDLDIVSVKQEDGIDAGINLATLITKEYNLHPPVTYPRFGTAKIDIDGEEVEFVAPRKEQYSPDSRKPMVERGTLEDDARRRDFTVNALYKDLGTGEVVDPTGNGLNDLKTKTIRVTDYEDPDVIFSEDPLRALRAVRQAYSLGFTMEDKTKEAIQRNVERLPVISQERIRDEFQKILTGPKAGEAVRVLHDIGLLKQFLPEMEETFGVSHDSKYHEESVDEHILSAIDEVPNDIVSRLVALLHDISKPAKKTIENGIGHFIGHEMLSADTARAVLERLKFPGDVIEEVVFRVRQHMRPHQYKKDWNPKTVRKFIKDMGDYMDKVLDFAEADIRASRGEESLKEEQLGYTQDLREKVKQQQEQGFADVVKGKPLLDGTELQQIFNKNPGAWIGQVHKHLADLQLENPTMTKEEAIEAAKRFMAQQEPEPEAQANFTPRTLVIGSAGFNHDTWKGTFYPLDIRENEKMMYFARHIPSVEINASEIPRRDVFERWAAHTPAEFKFSFRLRLTEDIRDRLALLYSRANDTIGPDRIGAVSIVVPEGTPFVEDPSVPLVLAGVNHMVRIAYDIESIHWICDAAYNAIKASGSTLVRNHLMGGEIPGTWSYIRMPVYAAMREANLGNRLQVFAMDDIYDPDPNQAKQTFVYVPNEPDRDTPKTIKQLMELLKIKYQPSPIDLSKIPHFGPTDNDGKGPNDAASTSASSSEEALAGQQWAEEKPPLKPKPAKKPGVEELTPTTTFDFADGTTNTDGKVDKQY